MRLRSNPAYFVDFRHAAVLAKHAGSPLLLLARAHHDRDGSMLVVIETMRTGEPEIATVLDDAQADFSTHATAAVSLTALTNWLLRQRGFDEMVGTWQITDAFRSLKAGS